MGRLWTDKEIEYLCDAWGNFALKNIADNLNRTETAIRVKVKRLKLGCAWSASDILTAREVSRLLNVDIHTVTDTWIRTYGLKAKKRNLTGNKQTWFIKIDDLVKWLKNNQDKWNSYRVEMFALGVEPEWLVKKRKIDVSIPERRFQKYTKAEDMKIIHLYKKGASLIEIGNAVNRSDKSVSRRIGRLDVWGTGEYIGGKK